jgi:glycosyltransferase involved in cell wall biosynthesis
VPPLVIVGDGPDRKVMERLAKESGVSHLVEFRGRIEGAEKYRLMPGAHAVLMPSRRETFGLVAIESLAAAGAPLVAGRYASGSDRRGAVGPAGTIGRKFPCDRRSFT